MSNSIEVCSKKCNIDMDASTPTDTVCRLPRLPTKYSNSNYMIGWEVDKLLTGHYFSSEGADKAALAFDGTLD